MKAPILRKEALAPGISRMVVSAPAVAAHAAAGQFVILRPAKDAERIPLTISSFDPEAGTVTIVYQTVGATTMLLDRLSVGDSLPTFTGPLGRPSHLSGLKNAAVIGGGLGCAIALPSAKAFKEAGAEVTVIVGFRSKDIVILEDEFKAAADRLILMTDDGTYGRHGLVTQPLQELLEAGETFDEVLAIGPVPMMKFVCRTTQPFGVHTMVSLNPIMVDGTGMCGGCRLTVGGETKFACVDGPEFDGHQVDFAELTSRNATYRDREAEVKENHVCRIESMGKALIK